MDATPLGLATHEASHAVVGYIFGLCITLLQIDDDGRGGAMQATEVLPYERTREAILIALAGGTAQLKTDFPTQSMLNDRQNRAWSDDQHKADKLYSRLCGNRSDLNWMEEDRIVADIESAAHQAIKGMLDDVDLWQVIQRIGEELLARRCLNGSAFRSLVVPQLASEKIAALQSHALFWCPTKNNR